MPPWTLECSFSGSRHFIYKLFAPQDVNYSNRLLCKLIFFSNITESKTKTKKNITCKPATKGESYNWYIQYANQKLQILTRVSAILPFRGHSFITSSKWNVLTAPPLTSTAIRLCSALPSTVLQWMSIIEFTSTPSLEKWYFELFLVSFISVRST